MIKITIRNGKNYKTKQYKLLDAIVKITIYGAVKITKSNSINYQT